MEWGAFLKFLSTPQGATAALSAAVVILAQFWPRWRKQKLNLRLTIVAAVCFGVPLGAAALGVWTEGWSPLWQVTFWPAVQAGGLALVPAAVAEGLDLGGKAKDSALHKRDAASS